ncbi:MAG: fructosamine kinase family protein [Pseudomonadota bacterium]
MADWQAIATELEAAGLDISDMQAAQPVAGGDSGSSWRLALGARTLFLKTAPLDSAPVLAAEAAGLSALRNSKSVRVPETIASGVAGRCAYLALEWLVLEAPTRAADALLGQALAGMHKHTASRYGWHQDNWIGRTPQVNTWHESWARFFADARLAPQLALARNRGASRALLDATQALIDAIPQLLADRQPRASLLHGDLWSGNRGVVRGRPVLYDPAAYYGDRETDIAMTGLFGGFSSAFYEAYQETWPLDAGYARREPLYQLYHVLNHVNLFGHSYEANAMRLLKSLLR